jgi:hypothetical protein
MPKRRGRRHGALEPMTHVARSAILGSATRSGRRRLTSMGKRVHQRHFNEKFRTSEKHTKALRSWEKGALSRMPRGIRGITW